MNVLNYWPQFTMIVLTAMSLGVGLSKHGEPKTGNHNFTLDIIATIIVHTILYFGGFYS